MFKRPDTHIGAFLFFKPIMNDRHSRVDGNLKAYWMTTFKEVFGIAYHRIRKECLQTILVRFVIAKGNR